MLNLSFKGVKLYIYPNVISGIFKMRAVILFFFESILIPLDLAFSLNILHLSIEKFNLCKGVN